MNTLLDLYWTFARIGAVTFGGGYAMLPILERELADKRGWTTLDELRDYFSIGQCTPGVIALNVSTFIGEKRAGVPGALAATTGFLAAPIAIILVIAAFLTNFADLAVVQHAFAGIRVCVCVLIFNSVVKLWKGAVKDKAALALCLIVFFLSVFFDISPIVFVLFCGTAGVLLTRWGVRGK